MSLFDIIAVLLSIAALFAFVNARYLKLPSTIAQMAMGLVVSLVIVGLARVGVPLDRPVARFLESVDFDKALLEGMLSFLLFAGALHVDLSDLRRQRTLIATLATAGVVVTTAIIGLATHQLLAVLGVTLSLAYCLVFGALISPTDPIAVLSILKSAGAPKDIEIKIAGESLFNDGVAVVVFLVLLRAASGSGDVSVAEAMKLLAWEAGGGLFLGLLAGGTAFLLMRQIDVYQVEILISLGVVSGTYSLAMALHVSGPIAVVVAGLLVGTYARAHAMSENTRERLDDFWELLDEVLNAVLFVLIGLELVVIHEPPLLLLASAVALLISLAARFLVVAVPVAIVRRFRVLPPNTVRLLVWGGLRGGISVALALSIAKGPERDVILALTYPIVAFSILVQGMTIRRLVPKAGPAPDA